jgi:hypothetical protein
MKCQRKTRKINSFPSQSGTWGVQIKGEETRKSRIEHKDTIISFVADQPA